MKSKHVYYGNKESRNLKNFEECGEDKRRHGFISKLGEIRRYRQGKIELWKLTKIKDGRT